MVSTDSVVRRPRSMSVGGLFLALWTGVLFPQTAQVTTIQLFPSPPEILKKAFHTTPWRPTKPIASSSDPATIVPSKTLSAPILKECGFRSLWQEDLTKGRDTVHVSLFEFGDASGAFSFFSLQSQGGMKPKPLGDQSMSDDNDLWLWQSTLVVHLSNSNPNRRSKTPLTELGKEVSRIIHQRAELPNLVRQLPLHDQTPGSERYSLGPLGFQSLEIPVRMETLGLDMGAEVSTALYHFPTGEARLLLISYPTPQMARRYYPGIQSAKELLQTDQPSGPVFTKRAGPLVAIVFDTKDEAAATKLLGAIQYSANLTWDQIPPGEEIANYIRTIVQSVMLTGTILLFTLGVGVLFGLIRLGVKLWVPIPIFDRPQDVELIQLRLWEKPRKVSVRPSALK